MLTLRDDILLGADSDISGKDLIRKRIMTAFTHVTVKLIIISEKIFRFLYHIIQSLYFYKMKPSREKAKFFHQRGEPDYRTN